MKQVFKLKVNGEEYEAYVEPWRTLDEVLRFDLELTGTKVGCSMGRCGACTVLLDGKAVKSCLILVPQAQGREITTIEGLSKDGALHPIQQAFIDHCAVQCGYCTPGMILAAKAYLDERPDATYDEVRENMTGNLCRCTGYVKIMEAIMDAQGKMKSNGGRG